MDQGASLVEICIIDGKKLRGKKRLQGWDLNPRPPGYEPDELPDCSTLRQGIMWSRRDLNPHACVRSDGF